MNIGRRTQLIWWWRWGCWQDWSFRWCFGIWPSTNEDNFWQLFRYYHFGAFEVRRWFEDMHSYERRLTP